MNNNYYTYPYYQGLRAAPTAFTATTPIRNPLSFLTGRTATAPLTGVATTGASKITFSGILNGASKTLGVINQAIPVVYQIKPIWNNAKTMFRMAKALNTNETTTTNKTNTETNVKETKQEQTSSNNGPTFF